MVWDATKPPQGGPRLSAEIRQGWDAIERTVPQNLAHDPLFVAWAAGVPLFWVMTGTGAAVVQTGPGLGDTEALGLMGYAAKLTFGSATARLTQTRLPAIPAYYKGKNFAVGGLLKPSASSAARLFIDDGVGFSYSPYATAGAIGWNTVQRTLDAAATKVAYGLELASGNCYFSGAFPIWGAVPPQAFVLASTFSQDTGQPLVNFNRGGVLHNPNGIAATVNLISWLADRACRVVAVKGYRVGGTSASINARKNGSSNHLATALSLTSANTWMDGGAVQNTDYAAGDKMEVMLTAVAGSPTQIGVLLALVHI